MPLLQDALNVRSVSPLQLGAGAAHVMLAQASASHAPFAQPFAQLTITDGNTQSEPEQPAIES
ncbi:MAG: hypothetical protein AB7O24_26515 [Kofleriaceae bacterium]